MIKAPTTITANIYLGSIVFVPGITSSTLVFHLLFVVTPRGRGNGNAHFTGGNAGFVLCHSDVYLPSIFNIGSMFHAVNAAKHEDPFPFRWHFSGFQYFWFTNSTAVTDLLHTSSQSGYRFCAVER
jgi:hypothetical protein